jgi:hypothetical protein
MGMGNTRQWFLDSWTPFIGNLGATEAIDIGEEVILHSQPLQLIDEILHVVGAGLEEQSGN